MLTLEVPQPTETPTPIDPSPGPATPAGPGYQWVT
jgi:hypothetical protein